MCRSQSQPFLFFLLQFPKRQYALFPAETRSFSKRLCGPATILVSRIPDGRIWPPLRPSARQVESDMQPFSYKATLPCLSYFEKWSSMRGTPRNAETISRVARPSCSWSMTVYRTLLELNRNFATPDRTWDEYQHHALRTIDV